MGEDYIDQLLASGQEPEDLTQIVSSNSAPVTQPTWEPLAQQISQQWQQYGINPDIKGINRANELAQILYNYGITDLSKLGIRQTPYEEMRGGWQGGDSGEYVEALQQGNRGQLTYGDQTFGRLGGFGSGGEKEFAAPQEFLTEAGNGRYGLGYSAAGKGWTDYEVVVKPDGTPVIVPRWGSSSDIDPELVQFLSIAAMPFTGGLSSALGGGLAGQVAAQALVSGTLGGLGAEAQGGSFGKGFGRGAVAGGLGAAAAPYLGNLGSAASDIVGGGNLGEIVSGAVKGAGQSAVGAAVTSSSIGDALLTGAAGGAAGAGADLLVKGTNSTLGQYLKDVPAPIRDSVLAAAGAGILGKDPSKAAVNALISSAMKGAKGGPSGQAASAGYGGADQGFFDPDAETSPLPDWALDPYKDDTSTFAQSPDEAYEDIESLLARYENQGFADAPTGDVSQSIDITGRRETDIPDWDILPDVYTPRSIRDIGTVTQVQPGEKLEGTEIKEPDLTTGLTPAVTAPAPKPATPGKAPTPSPAPKAAKPGMDIGALFALLGAMGGQQPTQAPAPYQTARINTESPFGLMYGLES